MGFPGYKRPDGGAGVRNHVVVMSSVSCVNGVVNAIGRALPEVKTIVHTEGCGRGLEDVKISSRTLIGLARNPNVYGTIVVGLGCEFIKASSIAAGAASSGKPLEQLVAQELGGSRKTAAAGIELAARMLAEAARQERVECGFDLLCVGLECGGSDALSGITANPLVGAAADWLVEQGATVILSETTEMIGAENVLCRRAASPELAEKILATIQKQRRLTQDLLGPLASLVISPGNMDGGLSSISEKSLGCVVKGGTTTVREVVDYANRPAGKGLVIMDAPGSDIFQLTGMAAGGATLVLFTTGRGTPAGFPIVPVIKIASNSDLYRAMEDDMDVDAGRLLEGVTLAEAGGELVELLRRVAAGELTKAESNRQDVLSIHTVGPAF
jgi:altronate dehydratase large subunit